MRWNVIAAAAGGIGVLALDIASIMEDGFGIARIAIIIGAVCSMLCPIPLHAPVWEDKTKQR